MTRSYHYLIVAGLLLLLGVGAPVAAAAGPLTGWTYDPLVITIPAGSVTEPLDNFPVMIKLDRDAGANGADLRGILAVLGSDANRKRIAVATADGTLCPVEIAEWSTADLRAILWVKVPRIEPDQDTKLYLYFDPTHAEMTQYVGDTGEPAAQQVWSNGYAGVWLMKPNGGRVLDSTANGNHGTIYGATATQGPTGTALAFDGIDDYVSIPDSTSLSQTTTLTLEANIQTETPHTSTGAVTKGNAASTEDYMLYVTSSGTTVDFYCWNAAGKAQSSSPRGFNTYDGSPHYYAGVAGNGWMRLYADGSLIGEREHPSLSIRDSGNPLYIGRGWGYFTGSFSYVAVSSTPRSPAWIAAQNAVLHDTFVTYTFDATGWTYDPLVITIPAGSVTEPLDNFPVMIKLDRDAGANGADLRGILAVLGSDANRKRIAVATADGTPCPVEIAEWSTADLRAILWVKVPQIRPDQDTKLYLYFDPAHAEMTQYVGDTGEPAAQQVWSNGYAGVWLMKPNGGRVLDSTANGNHGTIYGATETDGPLGRCLSFDGVDDRVIIPHDPSLSTPTALTVDMLTQMTTHPGVGWAVLSKGEALGRTEWMNYIDASGTSVAFYSYNSAGVSRRSVNYAQHAPYDGVWRYYAATTDVMETHTYLNGGSSRSQGVTNAPQEIGGTGYDIYIGSGWQGYYAQCSVSFTTVSSIARSPAWIAAQNAVLHDTFVTYTYDGPLIASFHTTPAHTLKVHCTDLSLGNPTSWHWDFGDGRTSTEQNPTHTYASPGTYTITLTVTNAHGTDSSSQTLHVAPPSSVSFTYTVDGPELATGVPIHFQGLISSDATSWRWYFGDGATSEERNPTHTYSKTGTYRVTLTATNEYGSISFSQNLHVFTGTIADPTPPPTHGAAFRWDPETGYYTSYWFNREGSFIDVHGLFFALMLPLTQIFGSWVFLIIWGTLCMGLYLYTQDTTMPFIIGILGGSMMAFLMGEDALVVMLLTMAFAGGGILAKVLLGRV